MTIVKRTGLGRAMTWSELDGNFDQVAESTAAAQQSASLAAASQEAAAASQEAAAASASDAADQAAAASTLRTDLASSDTGKGLSLVTAEDGTTGQDFYNNADLFAGAYEDSTITITSEKRWITYNGQRWVVKPGVNLPFTTTGINVTSWVVDSPNFTPVGDTVLLDKLSSGTGDLVGTFGGKTLAEFSKNINHYVGIRMPYYTEWAVGAISNYNDVWRFTDGSFWTGFSGALPSTPYPYNLRRYNILTDPLAVKEMIATIASNDADDTASGSYDLLGALLDAITGRTGIIVNSSFLSGIGTMSSALTVQPLLYRIGMCQRPFDATSDNPGMATLSSTEAGSGKPGWVNTFAQSNLGDLGITSGSTTKALVFTGKLQDNFLFRHAVTAAGDIYVEVMSSAGNWSGTWIKYYSTRNTTVASDGTLSAASPIVRVVESVADTERTDLLSLDFTKAGDYGAANSEASGVTVTKQSTGVYIIEGCTGLYPDGWQVKDAYPIQGSSPVALGRAEEQADGSVKVSVYARKMVLDSSTMEVTQTLGDPMDVPATSWIDVRVSMADTSTTEQGS